VGKAMGVETKNWIESINKSLRNIIRTTSDMSDATDKEIDDMCTKNFMDPGYKYDKWIQCKECSRLFKPFYFGDKSYHREVMMDCKFCGELNSFRPIDAQGESDLIVLGK
jgi:hypothetical protein